MTPQEDVLREVILNLQGLMTAIDAASPNDKQAITRIQRCDYATRSRKLIKEFYS